MATSGAELRSPGARPAVLPSNPRWGALTCAVLVATASVVVSTLVTGGQPRPAPAGVPDAGRLTEWLLPFARAAFDGAAAGTVGVLLALGWLVPHRDGRLTTTGRRLATAGARWASAWAAAAVVLLAVSMAQLLGRPVPDLLGAPGTWPLVLEVPQGRALLLVAVVATGLAVAAPRARDVFALRLLLVLALSGTAPLLAAGHAASAAQHFLATQALLVHVLAALLWLGGLAVLALHVRGEDLAVAAPRFSALALGCVVAVAASGLLAAWARVGIGPDVWRSPYGALLATKTGALGLLVAAGWRHRRRSLPALRRGERRAFLRLAVGEGVVMSAVVGVAVVLSRTPTPDAAVSRARPAHAAVLATVDRGIAPLSPEALLTELRPDALVTTACVAAGLAYLVAVRRWRTQGWPAQRTAAFLVGLLLCWWAVGGGLGAYSAALLSAQLTQFLVLATLAPVLLHTGRPGLLLRADPQPRTRRAATGPGDAVAVWLAVTACVWATPLLQAAASGPLLHLVVTGTALTVGWVLVDALSRADARDRAVLLLVVAVLLLTYAAHLLLGGRLLAEGWYGALDWSWSDPWRDQRRAGLVVAAWGLVVVLVALAGAARGRPRTRRGPGPGPRRDRVWRRCPSH